VKILLTGAGGFIGSHLRRKLESLGGFEIFSSRSAPPRRIALDLESPGSVAELVRGLRPACVLHAAGWSTIADCERDPAAARRINTDATLEMAEAAARLGTRFVFFSTDQVFDGEEAPYADAAPTRPLHVYGQTKADAESGLVQLRDAIILRPSLVYGDSPAGNRSPDEVVVAAARRREPLRLFTDEVRSPVSAGFVADAIVALLRLDFAGALNLGGRDRVTRYELGLRVCEAYGLDPGFIEAVKAADLGLDPPRPRDLTLISEPTYALLGVSPPGLEDELVALARSRGAGGA
jgi:dTDP-4-dehydrorhamnose reductase